MTIEIETSSIFARDRVDLRAWSDDELKREALALTRKITMAEGLLLIETYESGATWQAALKRRREALKAAGLPDNFKGPPRFEKSMARKYREFAGRYRMRLSKIANEMERRLVDLDS
jgi:hypothetical protein